MRLTVSHVWASNINALGAFHPSADSVLLLVCLFTRVPSTTSGPAFNRVLSKQFMWQLKTNADCLDAKETNCMCRHSADDVQACCEASRGRSAWELPVFIIRDGKIHHLHDAPQKINQQWFSHENTKITWVRSADLLYSGWSSCFGDTDQLHQTKWLKQFLSHWAGSR